MGREEATRAVRARSDETDASSSPAECTEITTEPNRTVSRVRSRETNRLATIRTVAVYSDPRASPIPPAPRQMRLTGGGGATSATSAASTARRSGRATRDVSDSVRATMSSRSLRFLAMSASLRSSNRRRSARSRCVARDSRAAGGVAAAETETPSAGLSGGPDSAETFEGLAAEDADGSLALVSGSSVPSASPPPRAPRAPNLLAHPPTALPWNDSCSLSIPPPRFPARF